jgi:hypothetical protein
LRDIFQLFAGALDIVDQNVTFRLVRTLDEPKVLFAGTTLLPNLLG